VYVVISDTSPIRCLVHLQLNDILPKLFGDVLLPPAVVRELAQASRWFVARDVSAFPFLKVRQPSDAALVAGLAKHLDPGEAEAIALALEVRADLLLMDDMAARLEAARRGFEVAGVFGILLRAKSAGLLPAVMPLVDQLQREVNFFVSSDTRAMFAAQCREPD
jgi:predicted nucleic acid-binding protein